MQCFFVCFLIWKEIPPPPNIYICAPSLGIFSDWRPANAFSFATLHKMSKVVIISPHLPFVGAITIWQSLQLSTMTEFVWSSIHTWSEVQFMILNWRPLSCPGSRTTIPPCWSQIDSSLRSTSCLLSLIDTRFLHPHYFGWEMWIS